MGAYNFDGWEVVVSKQERERKRVVTGVRCKIVPSENHTNLHFHFTITILQPYTSCAYYFSIELECARVAILGSVLDLIGNFQQKALVTNRVLYILRAEN